MKPFSKGIILFYTCPLLAVVSCGGDDIMQKSDLYDPLSAFTIPLFTALPRETKVVFSRNNEDQIEKIELKSRVTYQEEPFEDVLVFTLMYNAKKELTSFETNILGQSSDENHTETTLLWANGQITTARIEDYLSTKEVHFEYGSNNKLVKVMDSNRTLQFGYDVDGNLKNFSTGIQTNPILEVYANYDDKKNPFTKLELPRPILILLLRNIFTDEQLTIASFLSQNNVFFEENEYSINGLPVQIGSFMSLEY